MQLYALLKSTKKTGEYHIFHCEQTTPTVCTISHKSICQKAVYSDGVWIASCVDEDVMRKECARIGQPACGICVSSLYANY